MRRLAALVGKEVRQHALAILGAFALLLPIVGMMLLGAAINPQNLSYFEAQRSGLLLFIPLLGLTLGNRLVVAEYYGRTQLFLEALPIERWEPVTVKYVLGLSVMLGATLLLLVVTALFAALDEPLDPLFLAILAGRSIGFVTVLWSFLFLMGFTGRFRLALYVVLIFSLVAVGELTDLDVARFGPFSLIDETMPYERVTFPFRAFFESVGLALAFLVAAYGLALIGDGSLAEALAKRMSAREKGAVGAALLVGLFTYSTALEGRRQPDPYVFPESTPMVEGDEASVQVAFDADEDRAAAHLLMTRVQADVLQLPVHLGWSSPPTIRVALRETLDGHTFEPVSLAPGDGVLVRANYTASDIDALALRATLLREAIDAHTHGRAAFEPQRFFLEGYARHLVEGDVPDRDRVTLLRALYVTRGAGVDEAHLLAWDRTRETWGPALAEGLAALAVDVLADEIGEPRLHALARALYEDEVGDDSWVTLRDTLRPFSTRFEEQTGMTLSALASRIDERLAELRRASWAAPVRDMPSISATVEVEVVEGSLRAIAARLRQSEPRRAGTVATLLHHSLAPVDGLLEELELGREDVAWAGGSRETELRLEGRYGPGERAFLAIEVDSPELGCPIRVAAERRTIR